MKTLEVKGKEAEAEKAKWWKKALEVANVFWVKIIVSLFILFIITFLIRG